MDFNQKALVTLRNNISLAGDINLSENYCYVKQSEKSNIVCVLPFSSIETLIDIKGNKIAFRSESGTWNINVSDEKKYIRVKGGISFFGYITDSNDIDLSLSEGVLLSINEKLPIFYFIPDVEII